MSFTRLVYLYCDGPSCPLSGDAYINSPDPDDALSYQRDAAKQEGWKTALPGGRDLCPDCVEAGE